MPPGQPTHTSSRDATQTQNHSPTGGSAGICVASKLDQVLAQQDMAAAPLLLTAANVSPLHVPADDLLHFVAVQQWVHNILKVQLPLLNGAFVLVPSPALEQTAHSAAADAFPWRLRQVAGVKLGPVGSDPAAATVVLVGGDSVAAGDVCSSALDEVQDYQVRTVPAGELARQMTSCTASDQVYDQTDNRQAADVKAQATHAWSL